jgi:hypothetical protein
MTALLIAYLFDATSKGDRESGTHGDHDYRANRD